MINLGSNSSVSGQEFQKGDSELYRSAPHVVSFVAVLYRYDDRNSALSFGVFYVL